MFWLTSEHLFPSVESADADGILCLGGDLHPNRLLVAYRQGIFPWYNEGEPIVWYSPNPRMVLRPREVKISKSMRKLLDTNSFTVTYNQQFQQVIENCQQIKRKGQQGTWITNDLKESMLLLHKMGIAKSVEVWENENLVGGLYGIDLGNVFTGESMFSRVPNASKYAFINLCGKLEKENYQLLDCQVYNSHLESLGAYEISRNAFLNYLKNTPLL